MNRCPLLIFLFLVACVSAWAGELTPSLLPDQLDLTQCRAYDGARDLGTPDKAALAGLLGLAPAANPRWEITPPVGKDRYFRVAFTVPVAIGTIYSDFTHQVNHGPFKTPYGATISYLKPEAAYPGDVQNDDQWTAVPVGQLVALPAGVKTRALRFSDRSADAANAPISLKPVLLLQERYASALLLGESKRITAKSKPDVWIGGWNEPQSVAGLLLHSVGAQTVDVDYLKTAVTVFATAAGEKDWKHAAPGIQPSSWSLYRFPEPITTRGVRLTTNLGTPITTFLPLIPLGEKGEPPSLVIPPPPYQFKYEMPMDGFAAIEVQEKATGKTIRHLIAEVPRGQGAVNEPWDLKDDDGNYVLPGDYTWKAIARPPFKNTYEITVNNAGQPAWRAPAPGKGGGMWLGDHSAPIAACAVGDLVFLGAPVSENGNSIIAVDHDGNMQWSEGALQLGFFGPKRIASDGRCAYLVKEAFIQRIDPLDHFKTQTVYDQKATRDLPDAPVGGAAGRDGKLYVSYNAPPVSWLLPSFTSDQLDPKRSIPMITLKKGNGHRGGREDKNYGEFEYDELERFYAAFLTDTMPADTPSQAGNILPSSADAYFGDAAAGGPLGGMLVAAYKQPVMVGTVLVPDARMQVFALKPGAKLPEAEAAQDGKEPDVLGGGGGDVADDGGGQFNEEDWVPLTMSGKAGQPGVALAPEGGIKTQALRFKAQRLPFTLVMAHRLENLAPQATPVYGEGAGTPRGGWATTREEGKVISKYDPAEMALVWKTPVQLRGVSLLRPTPYSTTAVDYWVGPADGDPAASLADDTCWKESGTIQPIVFNGYAAQIATERSVDFGLLVTTRAVRVRVLEPEGYRHPPYGTQLVEGPHKAGFDAILAFGSLGNDPPLPPELSQRVTEYQIPELNDEKGRLKALRQIPLANPGFMTFDAKGTLYAVSDNQIVTVPLDGGQPKVVVPREELEKPAEILKDAQASFYHWKDTDGVERYAGLAVDGKGLFYLADIKAQVIKVFDGATGKFLRIIGTPGGPEIGPFDPTRFDNPIGITIDTANKLWVAESRWQPKRVTRWSLDGTLEKQFMGPTGYGGGGRLDEGNRNNLYWDGMKFVIDWAKHTWKLDSILACQTLKGSMFTTRPDRPVYLNGHRYMVADPGGTGSYFAPPITAVYREENGKAIPLAAAGNLAAWGDIDLRPDLKARFGKLERERYGFLWWDKNGDGDFQADEVQITDKNPLKMDGVCRVGENLSLNFGGYRLLPTGFTSTGTPMYDLDKLEKTPALAHSSWTASDGRTFIMDNSVIAADGKTPLWQHKDKFLTNGGYYAAGLGYSRPPGMLLGEDKVIGHFTLGKEEYWVTNSDQGDWFVYTGDLMLVGCISGGPEGYGLRQWTMPEWEPGKVDLSDFRVGQEHYAGCVMKADDGHIYAVAGHNHNSVVLVEGLEQLQRLNGELTVAQQDIEKTQNWVVAKEELEKSRQAPKVASMPYITGNIAVNGSLDDWPPSLFFTVHDYWTHSLLGSEYVLHSKAALSYDDKKLYVAVSTMDNSAMKNSAPDLKLLFKYGDAVDVQLGLDPKADPKRRFPTQGDVRLLITIVNKEPVVMAYRYKVDNAPAAGRAHFQSPVGEVYIDEVEQIKDAEVAFTTRTDPKGTQFVDIEASIPWKGIGADAPKVGDHLRGDVGLLVSDQNGVRTVNRLYWSGKSQTVVADIPSEAKIVPALWGEIITTEPDEGMHFGPEDVDIAP